MGGHALLRTDDTYRSAVELGARLTGAGRTVLTGGGPGAMEAANLGAYLSPWPDALDEALTILATAPAYAAEHRRLGPRGRRRTPALATRRRRPEPQHPDLVLRPRADECLRHRDREVLRERAPRGHLAPSLPRRHRLPAGPGRHRAGDLPGRHRELLRRGPGAGRSDDPGRHRVLDADLSGLGAVAASGRRPPAGRRHPLRGRRRLGGRAATWGGPAGPDPDGQARVTEPATSPRGWRG